MSAQPEIAHLEVDSKDLALLLPLAQISDVLHDLPDPPGGAVDEWRTWFETAARTLVDQCDLSPETAIDFAYIGARAKWIALYWQPLREDRMVAAVGHCISCGMALDPQDAILEGEGVAIHATPACVASLQRRQRQSAAIALSVFGILPRHFDM